MKEEVEEKGEESETGVDDEAKREEEKEETKPPKSSSSSSSSSRHEGVVDMRHATRQTRKESWEYAKGEPWGWLYDSTRRGETVDNFPSQKECHPERPSENENVFRPQERPGEVLDRKSSENVRRSRTTNNGNTRAKKKRSGMDQGRERTGLRSGSSIRSGVWNVRKEAPENDITWTFPRTRVLKF